MILFQKYHGCGGGYYYATRLGWSFNNSGMNDVNTQMLYQLFAPATPVTLSVLYMN
jgi:hypothetical protein